MLILSKLGEHFTLLSSGFYHLRIFFLRSLQLIHGQLNIMKDHVSTTIRFFTTSWTFPTKCFQKLLFLLSLENSRPAASHSLLSFFVTATWLNILHSLFLMSRYSRSPLFQRGSWKLSALSFPSLLLSFTWPQSAGFVKETFFPMLHVTGNTRDAAFSREKERNLCDESWWLPREKRGLNLVTLSTSRRDRKQTYLTPRVAHETKLFPNVNDEHSHYRVLKTMHTKFWLENLKGGDHDVDVRGWVLGKSGLGV